jgi:hypothetical protein
MRRGIVRTWVRCRWPWPASNLAWAGGIGGSVHATDFQDLVPAACWLYTGVRRNQPIVSANILCNFFAVLRRYTVENMFMRRDEGLHSPFSFRCSWRAGARSLGGQVPMQFSEPEQEVSI